MTRRHISATSFPLDDSAARPEVGKQAMGRAAFDLVQEEFSERHLPPWTSATFRTV